MYMVLGVRGSGHGLNTPRLKNLGPPTPPLLLPWNCSAYSFAFFFFFAIGMDGENDTPLYGNGACKNINSADEGCATCILQPTKSTTWKRN